MKLVTNIITTKMVPINDAASPKGWTEKEAKFVLVLQVHETTFSQNPKDLNAWPHVLTTWEPI